MEFKPSYELVKCLGQSLRCISFHPSTNEAWPCLAAKIRQDWTHSGWYDCR